GPCVSPSVYHKSRQGKQKELRYAKINPDSYAYAKRTARRVAATPARRSHPVGPSRTTQAHACRLLEDPHLAISCAHGTNARRLHRAPANSFTTTCGSNIPNGSRQHMVIQIGCAGEGQVSDRLQKNFGEWLKCGEHRYRNLGNLADSACPKLPLRLLLTDDVNYRVLGTRKNRKITS